jgi:nucleoside-diphosphate-sugar epimerase
LLGYEPKTPFKEGIKKLVQWYNEEATGRKDDL